MERLRNFAQIISAVTFLAFLSGCAQTPDARKTQAQGTAIGAIGGAALGALLGYATGGAQGAAQGAIAGGAIGAAGGYAYGTHVAHEKAKFASREAWLDQCIASAQRANDRAYAYNHSLNRKIASLQARSKAALASGNKGDVRAIHQEIVTLSTQAKAEQKNADDEIAAQQGASSDASAHSAANYGAYSKEMDQLRQTDASLSRNVNRLASLENQVNL
jgi:hypothetical protein